MSVGVPTLGVVVLVFGKEALALWYVLTRTLGPCWFCSLAGQSAFSSRVRL